MERRSAPIMTLSLASSSSLMVTTRLPRRAASKAASLTRVARSAPEKRVVPRAQVHAQDLFAAAKICIGDDDMTVEATRTQEGGIEHVGTVGRCDQDDAFGG